MRIKNDLLPVYLLRTIRRIDKLNFIIKKREQREMFSKKAKSVMSKYRGTFSSRTKWGTICYIQFRPKRQKF